MDEGIDEAVARVLAQARARATSAEGQEAYERSLERARVDEERAAAARRRRALEEGGWPLTDETLDAIVHGRLTSTRALERASAWAAGPYPVLVLLGDPGTGKTTAAAHVASRRSGACVYVREHTLGRWWASDRHAREWRQVLTAPTLVVDELGTAPDRALLDVRLALLEAVDARQRGVRTVLIGNLEGERFKARYDGRMIDRLDPIASRFYARGPSLRAALAPRRTP